MITFDTGEEGGDKHTAGKIKSFPNKNRKCSANQHRAEGQDRYNPDLQLTEARSMSEERLKHA